MISPLQRETFLNCTSVMLFSICIILTAYSRPAGGSFTVEIASNRGVTSLSYDGQYATAWGDGQNYPDDYSNSNCITSPNREYGLFAV